MNSHIPAKYYECIKEYWFYPQFPSNTAVDTMEDTWYGEGRKDRVVGAIIGHALGDALGAPVEFPPFPQYTGTLDTAIRRNSRAYGWQNSAVGQTTDDTDMAICLLRTLGEGYTRETAVVEYMNWVNNNFDKTIPGNSPFTGANTRNLFLLSGKSQPSLKLYNRRAKKWLGDETSRNSKQSNGCLMRAYPLAFSSDPEFVKLDCELTNPNPICLEAVTAYVAAVRLALEGSSKSAIRQRVAGMIKHKALVAAYEQAENNTFRDVTESRGWVAHAFYCAFWALLNFEDYKSGIDAVISLGPEEGVRAKFCFPGKWKRTEVICGDTDTNGAIAGALMGAYYGMAEIRKTPVTSGNIDTVLSCDPEQGDIRRPERYLMNHKNLSHLVDTALNLK